MNFHGLCSIKTKFKTSAEVVQAILELERAKNKALIEHDYLLRHRLASSSYTKLVQQLVRSRHRQMLVLGEIERVFRRRGL